MRFAWLIAALAFVPAVAAAEEAPNEALPFIDDDYARALREANASKRPIFVDAWAPW